MGLIGLVVTLGTPLQQHLPNCHPPQWLQSLLLPPTGPTPLVPQYLMHLLQLMKEMVVRFAWSGCSPLLARPDKGRPTIASGILAYPYLAGIKEAASLKWNELATDAISTISAFLTEVVTRSRNGICCWRPP